MEGGRPVPRIERLAPEARTAELARMLGGGEAAARHAQALLAETRPEQEELAL